MNTAKVASLILLALAAAGLLIYFSQKKHAVPGAGGQSGSAGGGTINTSAGLPQNPTSGGSFPFGGTGGGSLTNPGDLASNPGFSGIISDIAHDNFLSPALPGILGNSSPDLGKTVTALTGMGGSSALALTDPGNLLAYGGGGGGAF